MLAVTTFPPWGWDVYARQCIDSWVKAWPGSILAYYEGTAPPAQVHGVEFRPLDDIEERKHFLKVSVPETKNYLYDVKRFCHKVFAQLDAAETNDKFWWIDSDVEMTQSVPYTLLDEILNSAFVSFLGRTTYTETGVIAFNQDFPESERFFDRYMACYSLGMIFNLPYWTDCHAFDFAREGKGNNLTPKGRGVENVLPQSPLGGYMKHHKGRLKLNLERT